jgi:hypothetical protein
LILSIAGGLANARKQKYSGMDINRDGVITYEEWRGNNQSFFKIMIGMETVSSQAGSEQMLIGMMIITIILIIITTLSPTLTTIGTISFLEVNGEAIAVPLTAWIAITILC